MSVEEILNGYDTKKIIEAARRIKVAKELRGKLKDSRWSDTPIIFDNDTYLLPTFNDYRPLSVTLHTYGLWVEPIYTMHHSGKPERGYALHINEGEDGLRIYVEDSFDITLQGSYDDGFILKSHIKDNTKVEEV